MNKIKLLLIFVIILSIVVLIFNIEYVTSYNKYLPELKSQFNSFLYKYSNFDDELPIIINKNENKPCEYSSLIHKDKAVEDVEYLFSLLKFGYSGYEFFGGDDRFISAKENILWSVIALNDDNICVDKFLDIIYSELSFIQDAHFTIGNYNLCTYTKYFSSRKFTFYKDEIGLYTEIDNELFYLKSVNHKDP